MSKVIANYESFLGEHGNEFGDPVGAIRMLNDHGMSQTFFETLLDGYDSEIQPGLLKLLERQQGLILSEAANVPSFTNAPMGWTVLSFPMLVDIYSEPLLAELCNLYTVDKPIISVPRARLLARTRSYDGKSVEEVYFPTPSKMVRANMMDVEIMPNTTSNIFTITALSPETMRINKRYTAITSLHIVEKDSGGTVVNEQDVAINFRPDSRSHFNQTFSFTDVNSESVDGVVNGSIDYTKGNVQYQVLFTGGSFGNTYESPYAVMSLKFMPTATMNGRTTVQLEMEMTDLSIDPCEDFLIDLTEEEMQDYNAIYKINLLRLYTEGIKRQILLNKDFELAYFLKLHEPDMAKQGAKQEVDLYSYTAQGNVGDFTPSTVSDVLRAISPRVSTLISVIRRNFNMYPTYMLAGLKAASMLRSLQDMVSNIPSLRGEVGFSGSTGQFMKLKVIESTVLPENKIYLSTKAPDNALEKSTIVDFVFHPLYIIKEVTDGNTRHFVRSRTLIEILRTDGLGFIDVKNLDKYVG